MVKSKLNVVLGIGIFILGSVAGGALTFLLIISEENKFEDFNKYWDEE